MPTDDRLSRNIALTEAVQSRNYSDLSSATLDKLRQRQQDMLTSSRAYKESDKSTQLGQEALHACYGL